MKLDRARMNYMGKFIENSMVEFVESALKSLGVKASSVGGYLEDPFKSVREWRIENVKSGIKLWIHVPRDFVVLRVEYVALNPDDGITATQTISGWEFDDGFARKAERVVEAASRDLLVSLGDIGGWHEYKKKYYIPTVWRFDP